MTAPCLGVVLAGGAGSRVGGADKGLLSLRDRPLIAHVLDALRPQCDALLVVANRHLDEYSRFTQTIRDGGEGHAGPLAGIVAALTYSARPPGAFAWLMTLPVDCPQPPKDLRERLQSTLADSGEAGCAVAHDGDGAQPLFALYRLSQGETLLASACAALRSHASVLRWQGEIAARAVEFADRRGAFHNLNTPQEFRDYERMTTTSYPTRIALEQALEIVAARSVRHRLSSETLPLAGTQGRVLVEDVRVANDLPPFDNSAMDGFALRGMDLPAEGERSFVLVGDVFAGSTRAPEVGERECVRITTGAPMPTGADTVVIKENARVEGDRVFVAAGQKARANVRAAGEDFAAADLALRQGTRLQAAQLGVAAALGLEQVRVRRRPRAAVIVTGDELILAGQPLGFGQIHESNGILISALLREAGALVMSSSCVRDNPDALRAALLAAATGSDLIVSSGGVSAGEADHLPALLNELGEIHFHKVNIKPGMPVLFGEIGASLYFGLPGNPVSAAVTCRVFVRSAVAAMLGEIRERAVLRARLSESVHKKHARAELMRCTLHCDAEAVLWATPHAKQGSGMLRGLVESDALALLPEDAQDLERGSVVTLWP